MEITSNLSLGSSNFNQYNFFENYNNNLYDAILTDLKNKIETRDQEIMESSWRKNKGYIVKDKQQRTIVTQYGPVHYKRRRYRFWNALQGRYCYVYLVDSEFEIAKLERISLHLKLKILEEISSGSRQIDILKLYSRTGISKMTISNIIRHFDFANLYDSQDFPYEKVTVKNNLYVWIDETFVKLRTEGRGSLRYRFRLVVFHTGYKEKHSKNARNSLENKRAFCVIQPEKTRIKTKEFSEQVYQMATNFYGDLSAIKIIIGGDGAKFIEETASYLGSEYIIDLFHSFRKLYWALLKKQNSLYISCFKHACLLLKQGNFNDLINFLKQSDCLMWKEEQKEKLKSVIKYFATKEIAICNQAAPWNIGVNAEGQISHIIKWLLSYGAKAFNVKTFTNMLFVRIANINGINPVELLKSELAVDRSERINFLKENNWKCTKIYPEFWYQGKISCHSSKTRKSVLRFNANKIDIR